MKQGMFDVDYKGEISSLYNVVMVCEKYDDHYLEQNW